MKNPTTLPVWTALANHKQQIDQVTMREMFRDDPNRFRKYSIEWNGILFDYSKNRINDTTVDLLIELAEAAGVKEMIEAMVTGENSGWFQLYILYLRT